MGVIYRIVEDLLQRFQININGITNISIELNFVALNKSSMEVNK